MTDIALRNDTLIRDVDDISRLAKMAAESGYFPDARDVYKAGVKLLAGQGLGINPFQSLSDLEIVKGKPRMNYVLMGGLVKRSGRYNYRVVTHDTTICVIRWYENGEEVGTSQFTMDEAKARGLADQDNYRKMPEIMLFSRALSKGARMFCPDALGGAVYADDEIPGEDPLPPVPAAAIPSGDELAADVVDVLDATEIKDES